MLEMVIATLFTIVLTVDFLSTLVSKKIQVSEVLIRASMLLVWAVLLNSL